MLLLGNCGTGCGYHDNGEGTGMMSDQENLLNDHRKIMAARVSYSESLLHLSINVLQLI
jgi:hypothetical protein